MNGELDDAFDALELDAARQCDREQVQFIERLCEAGRGVSHRPAKIATFFFATMALGGTEAMERYVVQMEPFVRAERDRAQKEEGR